MPNFTLYFEITATNKTHMATAPEGCLARGQPDIRGMHAAEGLREHINLIAEGIWVGGLKEVSEKAP